MWTVSYGIFWGIFWGFLVPLRLWSNFRLPKTDFWCDFIKTWKILQCRSKVKTFFGCQKQLNLRSCRLQTICWKFVRKLKIDTKGCRKFIFRFVFWHGAAQVELYCICCRFGVMPPKHVFPVNHKSKTNSQVSPKGTARCQRPCYFCQLGPLASHARDRADWYDSR